MATASITGSVRVKSPVISTTLATEVSGARAAEVKTAPIATTAYSAGWPGGRPEEVAAISPNAIPEVAPTNSDGANTPPEPPMPSVVLQAMILPAARISRNHRT